MQNVSWLFHAKSSRTRLHLSMFSLVFCSIATSNVIRLLFLHLRLLFHTHFVCKILQYWIHFCITLHSPNVNMNHITVSIISWDSNPFSSLCLSLALSLKYNPRIYSVRMKAQLGKGSDYFCNDLSMFGFRIVISVEQTKHTAWLNMQLKRNATAEGGVYTVCINLQTWKFKADKNQSPQVVRQWKYLYSFFISSDLLYRAHVYFLFISVCSRSTTTDPVSFNNNVAFK